MDSAGVYLSIPFCRQKCTYCNFASEAHAPETLPEYLRLLESEITNRATLWPKAGIPAWEDATADTIYLGGGTPGLLTSEQLNSLVRTACAPFHVKHWEPGIPGIEVTLEAAPENVTEANAGAWAACGVNRISMGVQSMITDELRAVGRMHDADTVRSAVSALRGTGIENISVDLIAGLPHQTAASWRLSLDRLIELNPAHFSVYMLEVDGDSRLGREMLDGGSRYRAGAVPTEEQVAEIYCTAIETLRGAGYEQYEISNFARPGFASRHNWKYWTNAPYFGFGVDAHSYDGERRWANTDSLDLYRGKLARGESPVVECKGLAREEQLEERLFLGLRRRSGVSLPEINAEFAADVAGRYNGTIQEFVDAGWVEQSDGRLRLTDRGLLFSNEVFAGFIQE
jgi:oxygen-independent coproporphyrinogen-3 oxidase